MYVSDYTTSVYPAWQFGSDSVLPGRSRHRHITAMTLTPEDRDRDELSVVTYPGCIQSDESKNPPG